MIWKLMSLSSLPISILLYHQEIVALGIAVAAFVPRIIILKIK